jgi:hypothetical protein
MSSQQDILYKDHSHSASGVGSAGDSRPSAPDLAKKTPLPGSYKITITHGEQLHNVFSVLSNGKCASHNFKAENPEPKADTTPTMQEWAIKEILESVGEDKIEVALKERAEECYKKNDLKVFINPENINYPFFLSDNIFRFTDNEKGGYIAAQIAIRESMTNGNWCKGAADEVYVYNAEEIIKLLLTGEYANLYEY